MMNNSSVADVRTHRSDPDRKTLTRRGINCESKLDLGLSSFAIGGIHRRFGWGFSAKPSCVPVIITLSDLLVVTQPFCGRRIIDRR